MKCIDCNSEFSPFVHNQTRCRSCVTLNQVKQGSLKQAKNKLFFKDCRWCNKNFELQTTAQLYCSNTCRLHSKRASVYKLNFEKYYNLINRRKCDVCESKGDFNHKHHEELSLAIDHCHKTKVVRGLLCNSCNVALGNVKDDVNRLRKLIEYLERATTIPSGSTLK
jgi:hypothetical protein